MALLILLAASGLRAGMLPHGFFREAELGVTGGLSMARMWGLEAKDRDWKAGGWGGVYAVLPVAENLSFRPEVNFTMKGYRYSFYEDEILPNHKIYASLDLNYLDFPLLLQFAIPVQDGLVPEFIFGPVLSLNLAGIARSRTGKVKTSYKADNIRKTDLGIIAGARIRYKGRLFVNVRAGAGFLSIIDVQLPPKRYNLWGMAGIEYSFRKP